MPQLVGQHTAATATVLRKIVNETQPFDVEESCEPEHIMFADLVAGGMNLTHAYCAASGLPAPIDSTDAHRLSPARDRFMRDPGLRKLLKRKINERMSQTVDRGSMLRIFIEEQLLEIASNDMNGVNARLQALTKLANLTHVRALDKPEERKDDAPASSAEIMSQLKDLLGKRGG
jgi:hypothetical protein